MSFLIFKQDSAVLKFLIFHFNNTLLKKKSNISREIAYMRFILTCICDFKFHVLNICIIQDAFHTNFQYIIPLHYLKIVYNRRFFLTIYIQD